MNKTKVKVPNAYEKIELIIPAILGIVFFVLIYGVNVLDFSYTDWLMEGDKAQYFTSWEYFRKAQFWQFPLGDNYLNGLEISASIFFSDANSLLAIIFKAINGFLPKSFQYFGLWLILCAILQAICSWVLLSKFTTNRTLLILGSCLFLTSPIMWARMGGHFTYSAHWLILYTLYIYFSTKWKPYHLYFLAIFALVNLYILIICGFILLADFYNRIIHQPYERKKILLHSIGAGAFALYLMWVIGAFSIPNNPFFISYGYYRADLLTLINANGWSYFMPWFQPQAGGSEGSAYLGTGIIGLCLFAIIHKLIKKITINKNNQKTVRKSNSYRVSSILYFPHISLIIVTTFLCIFAITNYVDVGGTTLFSFDLPQYLKIKLSTFRASGRFVWLLYYLIYLFTIMYLIRNFSIKRTTILLVLALFIQIVENTKYWIPFHTGHAQKIEYQSPMKSKQWENISPLYKNLRIILPYPDFTFNKNWVHYTAFAIRNNMGINSTYLARFDVNKYNMSRKYHIQQVLEHNYNADSLYIFDDDKLWSIALQNSKVDDFIGEIDGFKVFAPNYEKIKIQNKE